MKDKIDLADIIIWDGVTVDEAKEICKFCNANIDFEHISKHLFVLFLTLLLHDGASAQTILRIIRGGNKDER